MKSKKDSTISFNPRKMITPLATVSAELDGWIKIIQHSQAWPQFQTQLRDAINSYHSRHGQITRCVMLGAGSMSEIGDGVVEEDRKMAIAQTAMFICMRDEISTYTVYRKT